MIPFLKFGILAVSAGGTTYAMVHWRDVNPTLRFLTYSILVLSLVALVPEAYHGIDFALSTGIPVFNELSITTKSFIVTVLSFVGLGICLKIAREIEIRRAHLFIFRFCAFVFSLIGSLLMIISIGANNVFVVALVSGGRSSPGNISPEEAIRALIVAGVVFALAYKAGGELWDRDRGPTPLTFTLLIVGIASALTALWSMYYIDWSFLKWLLRYFDDLLHNAYHELPSR
jgi:hypothetical protein